MSEAAEKLKAALMELPIDERLELAEFLFEISSPPPGRFAVGTPEFDAELDRRLADHESGKTKSIPAAEFFRQLREKRQ